MVFWGGATNLVPSLPAGGSHCYLRDRLAGTTELLAQTGKGTPQAGTSSAPAITPDGKWAAFASDSTELVPSGNNTFDDVFIKDLTTGAIERVSDGWDGSPGNGDSGGPTVSADGRVIAFTSDAWNLVPDDANHEYDVFVHDRTTGLTTRISVGPNGEEGDDQSTLPYVSADGRYVAFQTLATNLGNHPGAFFPDVLVHDRVTGKNVPVGIDYQTGHPDPLGSERAVLSADGRYVAFESQSSRLVPGDTNGDYDIFVRDLWMGTTTRVNVSGTGEQANDGSSEASISADGRYVAFFSSASNLVPGDTNGVRDVFVRDRTLGTTRLVSVNTAGMQGNDRSETGALSPDGTFIAFSSESTNLVPGWGNFITCLLYLRVEPPVGPSTYCLSQQSSLGCLPAISGTGAPSATAGSGFEVDAANLPNGKFGLLAYSTTASALKPFGGTFLCIAAPLRRTPVQQSGGSPAGVHDCSGNFGMDFNTFAASGKDPALVAGQTVWAQYWSRDPGAPSTTNLTDAITFVLGS